MAPAKLHRSLPICHRRALSSWAHAGFPGPDTVIIVDEDGSRLRPGEQGEILVRGPTVISGYLDAPELNRDIICRWLV